MTNSDQINAETLAALLEPLLERGVLKLDEIALQPGVLASLGFELRGDRVCLPEGLERLDESLIRSRLSSRALSWLKNLEVLEVVGSTSTLLGECAAAGSVEGMAKLAELQVQGRGRRGRGWFSPYGQNLALSLGARLPFRADELGGFSCCVGLAVIDLLQELGIAGAELKWPNDVLVQGRKLAGILVEIYSAGPATEVVIGIGVNFRLPPEARAGIDQPVIDLDELGGGYSRNALAAGLISSVVDFTDGFARDGFAPMQAAFNSVHHFHDQPCWLLMGDARLQGYVRGVTERGELLLETDGSIRAYSSGEVSLRPI